MATYYRAGAGCGEVSLTDACFPLDGFTGVHDPACVRVIILEQGTRIALAAVDTTNIDSVLPGLQDIISEEAEIPKDHIWIAATHSTGLPHTGVPPSAPDAEAMNRRGERVVEAVLQAGRAAAAAAANQLQAAVLTLHTGESDVNVCRDVETPEGWTLGFDPNGPSDHRLQVLSADTPDGKTIAALYTLALMPEVMVSFAEPGAGRLVTADLCGNACRKIEKALGHGAVAMFCPAAQGNQAPDIPSCRSPEMLFEDRQTAGFSVVEELGSRLCSDVLSAMQLGPSHPVSGEISAPLWRDADFAGQTLDGYGPGAEIHPVRSIRRIRTGIEHSGYGLISLGDVLLAGVRPALTTPVSDLLRKTMPQNTLLLCAVNGGQKCMADRDAYDKVQYGTLNTRVARGSAEKLVRLISDDAAGHEAPPEVTSVTAYTDAFPDGQKTTAAILAYGRSVQNSGALRDAYLVQNRTILRAYASAAPALSETGCDGPYVILELDPADEAAPTLTSGRGGHEGHGDPRKPDGPGGPGKPGGPPRGAVRKRQVSLRVLQDGDISAADGTVLPAWREAQVSQREENRLVDEFQVFSWEGMTYNLFVPRRLEPDTQYPLVLFLPDASCIGADPHLTLEQGNGAVVWTAPENQEKHPCFVLAPQYDGEKPLTNNKFEAGPELETIRHILDHVCAVQPVDRNRLYLTGQSMGCMAACEMNIRWPDLFAASLLVAGQWDPDRMARTMRQSRIWICVSRTDGRAFPGMTAAADAFDAAGVPVGRYVWDAARPKEELNAEIRRAAGDGRSIRFSVFWDVPSGEEPQPMQGFLNHMDTWPLVYDLEALRDWLFTNRR